MITILITILIAIAIDIAPDIPTPDPCEFALAGPFAEASEHVVGALGVCRLVVKECERQGVDPVVCMSIAFHETRLKNQPSHKGRRMLASGRYNLDTIPPWVERTAMQCKPSHHCPRNASGNLPSNWRSDCDFLASCVAHLKKQIETPRWCRVVPEGTERARKTQVCWMAGKGERACETAGVLCSRVARDSPRALSLSLDRYKYPYGPSRGYGSRVLPHVARVLTALR